MDMNLLSSNEPEIGDMDEGVVEGGEDTGDAEDEFTCGRALDGCT